MALLGHFPLQIIPLSTPTGNPFSSAFVPPFAAEVVLCLRLYFDGWPSSAGFGRAFGREVRSRGACDRQKSPERSA